MPRTVTPPCACLVVLLLAVACSEDADPLPPGASDAGGQPDIGEPDAGRADTGGAPDASIGPLCEFGGLATQSLGDPCGCPEDCATTAPVCTRNFLREPLGQSTCTIGCSGGAPCPQGYACQTLALSPFCERCAATPGSRTLEEACICDSDCGAVDIDGRPQALACRSGRCTRVGCVPLLDRGCPPQYACEPNGVETQCVRCSNAAPAPRFGACTCQRDCGSGLSCVDGVCREACTSDTSCQPGETCEVRLVGGSYCARASDDCTRANARVIGQPCVCNQDCASSAPTCVTLALPGAPITGGICTRRPCSVSGADSCGDPDFACCEVPLLLPSTCVPRLVTSALGMFGRCSP